MVARFIDIEPYEEMGYHNLVRFPNGNQFEAIYTPLDEIPTVLIIPSENLKPSNNPCEYCQEFDCYGCKYHDISNQ